MLRGSGGDGRRHASMIDVFLQLMFRLWRVTKKEERRTRELW